MIKYIYNNVQQQKLARLALMISAQIKKGNTYMIDSLEDYMLQMVNLPANKNFKPLKMNYFNFIETISELVQQFAKAKSNVSFNIFIIDSYVRKYDKTGDLYRYFFGLTQSWKKYADSQEDAKLYLSLLSDQRNDRESVKQFVKIRKIILKTLTAKVLEQISVTHSDALTICHMLFVGQNRNKIVKKINNLFISLKRKLVNTAKINGAVACQFFMNSITQLEKLSYPLQLLKNQQNKRHFVNIDDVSFRDQDEKKEESLQQCEDEQIQWEHNKDEQAETSEILSEIHNIENEWTKHKGMLDLNDAKKSLNKLSRKDRDIDAKLQGSGLIEWKNYPEGWDQFIRKNQQQKQKLLNRQKNDQN